MSRPIDELYSRIPEIFITLYNAEKRKGIDTADIYLIRHNAILALLTHNAKLLNAYLVMVESMRAFIILLISEES